jgi:predicted O-methyltransferase YrrM
MDYLIEEKLVGNIAEVGVYKGNSAFLLAKYAQRVNSTCYLFDTYEGFDQRDFQGVDSNNKTVSFSDTSLEYVKQIVGEKNVVYVEGYFPESLKQVDELSAFSLVHIDCDLEKPISEALKYFYPKLIKGGFLIMHDHSSLFWPGAKNAIDAFFKDKGEFIIPIPDKSGTCVIRKF